MTEDEIVEKTKEYYDGYANVIYREVWGGNNIHLGVFDNTDDFHQAAEEANRHLAEKLDLDGSKKVLDLGSGYGGACRYLARNYGCRVVGLNLSEEENRRAKKKNREEGLDHLVEIRQGDFNSLPFEGEEFDVVISQESFLHSPDKKKALQEAKRVLKRGGTFAFSDILRMPEMNEEEAREVYDRLNLKDMGSFEFYEQALRELNFEIKEVEDLSPNLHRTYYEVREAIKRDRQRLEEKVPSEVIDRTLKGLDTWVSKSGDKKLGWGLFLALRRG